MDNFMVTYAIVLICISIVIGVYMKLKHYGAPNSAVIYAISIPFVALLLNLKFSFTYVKKYKKTRKKILVFVEMQFYGIKNLSLLTGMVCIMLGEHKIGFLDLFKGILEPFNYINKVVERFQKDISLYDKKMYKNLKISL